MYSGEQWSCYFSRQASDTNTSKFKRSQGNYYLSLTSCMHPTTFMHKKSVLGGRKKEGCRGWNHNTGNTTLLQICSPLSRKMTPNTKIKECSRHKSLGTTLHQLHHTHDCGSTDKSNVSQNKRFVCFFKWKKAKQLNEITASKSMFMNPTTPKKWKQAR